MDEKRKLKVLDRTETELDETTEEQAKTKAAHKIEHKVTHPNQTNPIYKNLMNFENAKIGDKLSVKDLLR